MITVWASCGNAISSAADPDMIEIIVVCEGQTEEKFVKTVVAPFFHPLGKFLKPLLVGGDGGNIRYERYKTDVKNSLKAGNIVTSLIDLYALKNNFPGYDRAMQCRDLEQRLAVLNKAVHEDIVTAVRCRPERFIPYIQPYEIEALLFSDV